MAQERYLDPTLSSMLGENGSQPQQRRMSHVNNTGNNNRRNSGIRLSGTGQTHHRQQQHGQHHQQQQHGQRQSSLSIYFEPIKDGLCWIWNVFTDSLVPLLKILAYLILVILIIHNTTLLDDTFKQMREIASSFNELRQYNVNLSAQTTTLRNELEGCYNKTLKKQDHISTMTKYIETVCPIEIPTTVDDDNDAPNIHNTHNTEDTDNGYMAEMNNNNEMNNNMDNNNNNNNNNDDQSYKSYESYESYETKTEMHKFENNNDNSEYRQQTEQTTEQLQRAQYPNNEYDYEYGHTYGNENGQQQGQRQGEGHVHPQRPPYRPPHGQPDENEHGQPHREPHGNPNEYKYYKENDHYNNNNNNDNNNNNNNNYDDRIRYNEQKRRMDNILAEQRASNQIRNENEYSHHTRIETHYTVDKGATMAQMIENDRRQAQN